MIGLNGLSYSISANSGKEIVKTRDKTDELYTISNEKADFQIPMSHSDEISEIYGFELIFPNDNRCFQTFPSITLNITNSTTVNSYEYESRISSIEPSISIENSFDPENSDDWESFIADLEFVWDQIEESTQISIDFNIIEGGSPLYHSAIYLDLTAPLFTFGYKFDDVGALIPYKASEDCFSVSPYFYFNITDNLENPVDICLIVNTQLHRISKIATIYPSNNQQNMNKITLPEWDKMNDGLNDIPIYIIDSAGNPTSIKWIHIIKDTSPPEFKSDQPNKPWLFIGMEDISKYENPIYRKYEIYENPIFNCHFADIDIENVKLIVDLHGMEWEFEDDRYYSYFEEDIPSNQSEKYEMSLHGVHVNHTNWIIEFPDMVWEQFQNEDIKMTLVLNDFAGNIATHNLIIKHISSKNGFESNIEKSTIFISLGIILFCIALISFMSFSLRSIKEKYCPLEEDLEMIDHELLDVVIHPIDQENLIKVVKYCKILKNPSDYEKVLPPDILDFLKEPLQILNLKEIHLLLTRYNMDSLHLEEFVREMIALGSKERHQFLIDYMENYDGDTHELEFEDNDFENGDEN